MGGTDELNNLIELSIEDHAEAHKKLWEDHGRWQDKLAWQGLAGMISKEDIIHEILSETGKRSVLIRKGNKGKKYNWKSGHPHKPIGTGGLKWYHNPDDTTQKGCFKPDQDIPAGWILGQGKKSKNPGLNFHSKMKKRS